MILARCGDWTLGRENGHVVLRDAENGWMSDFATEGQFARRFACEMVGTVLVAGLGLGYHLTEIIQNPRVRSLEVVEASAEVMSLYVQSPYRLHDRITIRFGDFWRTTGRYDSAWLDIWRRPPSEEDRDRAIAYARTLTDGSIVTWPVGLADVRSS